MTTNNNHEKFDVAVIGGGPAGMLSAGRAAELGAKVVLIEKNPSLGKKLLITGKGRCNITQAEFSDREFVKTLDKNSLPAGRQGKFLFSSLNLFGPEKVIQFFEKRGMKTKTERGGRVFPVSDLAQDVLQVLLKYLKENQVSIRLGEKVSGFNLDGNRIKSVKLKEREIQADKFIIATGGKSYPATGSTGDGYSWLQNLGHTISKTFPALVPVEAKEEWVKDLQGLSLKNVALNIFQNGKKQDSFFGEMLFTHFGLSGPIVLDASKKISELLENLSGQEGEVKVQLDLKPALDFSQLEERLKRDFQRFQKKDFQNYLPELLPQKMIETIIKLVKIPDHKKINLITKEERKNLVKILKGLELNVLKTTGYNQAIIISGGVNLKEIDSKTMQSKIVKNLYLAGEILDLDGPTGGYNLQIAWSTGFSAGENAGQKSLKSKN